MSKASETKCKCCGGQLEDSVRYFRDVTVQEKTRLIMREALREIYVHGCKYPPAWAAKKAAAALDEVDGLQ